MAGGIILGASELLVRSPPAGARDGRRRNCSDAGGRCHRPESNGPGVILALVS